MKRLTKIINGILGAGNNRRTVSPSMTLQSERIWEVRCKHNQLVRGKGERKAN